MSGAKADKAGKEAKANLHLLGSTQLRFFGLEIYTAALYVPPSFNPQAALQGSSDLWFFAKYPLSLRITYRRQLEGALIAERSLIEMKRQGAIAPPLAQRWLDSMCQAFPDVRAGDTLTGESNGQGGVHFLHNQSPTAQMKDDLFAQRFFGIWLHPATSAPQMRRDLLALPA